MNKLVPLAATFPLLNAISAQITQIDCAPDKFYGTATDNKIYELTIHSGSVTLCVSNLTLTLYNKNSLAIANLGCSCTFRLFPIGTGLAL